MSSKKRYAILVEGKFNSRESKTANAILRYGHDSAAALIDSAHAGETAQDVIGYGGNVPVCATLSEALEFAPNALLIGIAPMSGRLPDEWRSMVMQAIESGLDIVSGMHSFIGDDAEFKEAAEKKRVNIHDLRRPPADLSVSNDRWRERSSYVLLTVGTDVAIGKMTTLLQLLAYLKEQPLNTAFVATGQTGLLFTEYGVCVDAVVSDFVAGSIESALMDIESDNDLLLVEGQGSLFHQGYSGVTLGLMHGSMPDGLIICHEPSRKINDYGSKIPTLTETIELHKAVMKPFKEVELIGISLYTSGYNKDDALSAIEAAEAETGLPADDPVRFGSEKLGESIIEAVRGR